MEYSDEENGSDFSVIDGILGPEDLFNEEVEKSEFHSDRKEGKGEPEKLEKDSTEKSEKKIKQPRIIKKSKVTLNFDALKGRNGLSALKKQFKNFKFKGSGHEKEDLAKIMGILQQWMCYQLYPSYDFESCMLQLETLGKKKIVQTLMKKYRLGIDDWGENKLDEEDNTAAERSMDIIEDEYKNKFELSLNKQIARNDDELSQNEIIQTQNEIQQSPGKKTNIILTPKQLTRITKNKKLAEERKQKKMNTQYVPMELNQPLEENED